VAKARNAVRGGATYILRNGIADRWSLVKGMEGDTEGNSGVSQDARNLNPKWPRPVASQSRESRSCRAGYAAADLDPYPRIYVHAIITDANTTRKIEKMTVQIAGREGYPDVSVRISARAAKELQGRVLCEPRVEYPWSPTTLRRV